MKTATEIKNIQQEFFSYSFCIRGIVTFTLRRSDFIEVKSIDKVDKRFFNVEF